MTPMHVCYYPSPIGLIEIAAAGEAITSLAFVAQPGADAAPTPLLDEAIRQLAAYFAGVRQTFDLPLALQGSAFQRRVWSHLLTIPYGRTCSYQEVAEALGQRSAIRAVGAANGRNPIAIIVPCHRVIGSDGKLVGYGGGLWRKEWLLHHEGSLLI